MKKQRYGGNLISNINMSRTGKQIFASGPYEYYYYRTKENCSSVVFDDLRSFTAYILDIDNSDQISLKGGPELRQGTSLQAEDTALNLMTGGNSVTLLVAGTKVSSDRNSGIQVTEPENIYKVSKPWGYELWINGEHPLYCLKKISICGGNRTSLQYHRLKQETNVLFSGKAKIHYNNDNGVNNDAVTLKDIGTIEIQPVSSVDIVPDTLHRVEAVSDIILYETSTPHLDDVVRVQDDSGRTHGRIESEHQEK